VQVLQGSSDRGSAPALWLVGTAVAVATLWWTTSEPARGDRSTS
jgi:hypothetical protein